MESPVDLWAFATDARTEQTLRQGLDGRAATAVRRGKLAEALRILAQAPAPKLVLVDLDGGSEPESAFAQLRAVCSFGTEFVALGSTDTANFARQLLHDGFADYLSKPVSVADVGDACATVLDDRPGRDYAGRVVGFAGGGGSGVSALVASVARESRDRDLSCAILSLDPVFSEAFGIEPLGDLSELLMELEDGKIPEFDPFARTEDRGAFKTALVAYRRADPLPVVPSIDTAQALIRHLANRASMVLLGGIPDPELLAALLRQADVQVVLYEPTLLSINVAVRCLALLGPDNASLLMQSQRRAPRSALSSAQIRYALGDRGPDSTLPYDAGLHRQLASIEARPAASRRYRKALQRAVDLIFGRIQ